MAEETLHSVTVGGDGVAPDAVDPLAMTAEEYGAACVERRVSGGRSGAFERYTALFRGGQVEQKHLRASAAPIGRIQRSESGEGTTVKFTQVVPRAGGRDARPTSGTVETESVLIPMIGRKGFRTFTLCVSSQVGCAMGCTFCQTAQMGLIRSLSPAEIVGQWLAATHTLGHRINNVVFMGMGEPLDNFENVIRAIAVLTDHRGAAVPMNKIVVSTVGRLDGLARLADQVRLPGWHRLNLAVSLNAPNDEVRTAIMPINRGMPMRALRTALEGWPIYGGSKICLEYVLIPGVNDGEEHAKEVAAFVLGRKAGAAAAYDGPPLPGLINLIPYNPRDNSPWPAPQEAHVERFLVSLSEAGVYAKRRRTKGRETMTACGQLGNPEIRRRRRAGTLAPSAS